MASKKAATNAPSAETGTQTSLPGPQPSFDPRLLAAIAAMYSMDKEDEIDLLKWWGIIRKHWKLIAGVMLAVAIISAGISLLLPNVYEAQVLMAPVGNQELGKSGGLGVMLGGSGLGSLAVLSGINADTGFSAQQNLAVMKSRTFLWDFVKDNKLMPVLFADDWDASKKSWKENDPVDQPNLWDAYHKFTKTGLLNISTNKVGLVTVSVDWTNPVLAADWANRLVARLNDYLRQQAIVRIKANLKYLNEAVQNTSVADVRQALFALIVQEQKKAMIANTQKQYAFEVLDAASPPDKKAKPHRALIVILSMLAAGFLALVFVFVQEGARQRRMLMDSAPMQDA